jgi:AraC-like DNA-binding protein
VAISDRRNVANYRWDEHVPGLSLLHADFTSHDYPAHTHDAFVVAVTELGGAEVSSRNVDDTICPTKLFVSNPGEPQSARMGRSQRWRYRSFYLTGRAIDVIAQELGIETVPYFTRNMFEDADLISGFGRLHQALEARNDRFLGDQQLALVFGELFRRHGSGGSRVVAARRDQMIVGRVVEVMQAHYAESLHLADLAHTVGVTSFQLIGMFKRTVGLTPHAYLIHIRLNMACRGLRRGHQLARAALEAGFYDQSALTKHFKRWYGITPLQFVEASGACRRGPGTNPNAAG